MKFIYVLKKVFVGLGIHVGEALTISETLTTWNTRRTNTKGNSLSLTTCCLSYLWVVKYDNKKSYLQDIIIVQSPEKEVESFQFGQISALKFEFLIDSVCVPFRCSGHSFWIPIFSKIVSLVASIFKCTCDKWKSSIFPALKQKTTTKSRPCVLSRLNVRFLKKFLKILHVF